MQSEGGRGSRLILDRRRRGDKSLSVGDPGFLKSRFFITFAITETRRVSRPDQTQLGQRVSVGLNSIKEFVMGKGNNSQKNDKKNKKPPADKKAAAAPKK